MVAQGKQVRIVIYHKYYQPYLAFVKRHLTGEFQKIYIPTIGVEVHPLKFTTNCGDIVFNVWDTAGQEKVFSTGNLLTLTTSSLEDFAMDITFEGSVLSSCLTLPADLLIKMFPTGIKI